MRVTACGMRSRHALVIYNLGQPRVVHPYPTPHSPTLPCCPPVYQVSSFLRPLPPHLGGLTHLSPYFGYNEAGVQAPVGPPLIKGIGLCHTQTERCLCHSSQYSWRMSL